MFSFSGSASRTLVAGSNFAWKYHGFDNRANGPVPGPADGVQFGISPPMSTFFAFSNAALMASRLIVSGVPKSCTILTSAYTANQASVDAALIDPACWLGLPEAERSAISSARIGN